MLHGSQHRSHLKMISGLKSLPTLFNIMKDYIQNNHNYCDTCPHVLQLK